MLLTLASELSVVIEPTHPEVTLVKRPESGAEWAGVINCVGSAAARRYREPPHPVPQLAKNGRWAVK